MNGAKKGDKIKFDLEINGDWHNFKNISVVDYVQEEAIQEQKPSINQDKDKSIEAQCLTKAWCNSNAIDMSKEDVLEAYRYFLSEL